MQVDSGWLKRLDAFLRLGKLIVLLLAGLFAAALIAVTFNTIRLQILGQAAEIEVARLIGATDAYVRRPFYYFGALQGAAGGLLAVLGTGLVTAFLADPVTELAGLYGSGFRLLGLSLADGLALTGLGGLLGWLGAQLSVGLYLVSLERR